MDWKGGLMKLLCQQNEPAAVLSKPAGLAERQGCDQPAPLVDGSLDTRRSETVRPSSW